MNQSRFLLFPLTISVFLSYPILALAQKDSRAYISVPIGYSLNYKPTTDLGKNSINKTFLTGIAAGYDFDFIRTELSIIIRNNIKISNKIEYGTNNQYFKILGPIKVNTHNIMLDFYKDFDINSNLTPFVNAGIGITRFKIGNYSFTRHSPNNNKVIGITEKKSSDSLALKVGCGINYALTKYLDLSLAYSYSHIGKISIISPESSKIYPTKLKASEMIASFRFKF